MLSVHFRVCVMGPRVGATFGDGQPRGGGPAEGEAVQPVGALLFLGTTPDTGDPATEVVVSGRATGRWRKA